MDLSIKTIILIVAVLLTGLSAGFFYAWSVSVIPGTQRIVDSTYLESMQNINRAILNPAFFLIFFGAVIFLFISSFTFYGSNKTVFWILLSASIIYLAGTFAVTGLGNVPLNNQLDALNLSEMSAEKMKTFRNYYENNWNRLHMIRTIFALCSFLISIEAIFYYSKN